MEAGAAAPDETSPEAVDELDVAALEHAPVKDTGPTEAEAVVPIQDVSTLLYGHSIEAASKNETLRRSWRRSSTLMNLLSEHNVQRIRMMFDAKNDGDGLSLSEFLFVLHKCLVRCSGSH